MWAEIIFYNSFLVPVRKIISVQVIYSDSLFHLYKYFRTSTSFLIILVNDVNDHAPQFTATLYTAVLDEAAVIGTFVAAPLAVDQDTGVNSNIYYR